MLRRGCLFLTTICLAVELVGRCAFGAIPAGERSVLLQLYTSTNGAGWTDRTNWNGAVGTECSWYGVTCNAEESHVIRIDLAYNNLTGTLPSLGTLDSLYFLDVHNNWLTGSIPTLSSLTYLQHFDVGGNQLTGSIPSLGFLKKLIVVSVGGNQLTGQIPSLRGLTDLEYFNASNNQLTGSIPSLNELTSLYYFYVGGNQLTGLIPYLGNLTSLRDFRVYQNQLTGSIPSLSGLAQLQHFIAFDNQLTGSIPSLGGLTNLRYFQINRNYLSGDAPAVPVPNSLSSGGSALCPNNLTAQGNIAWDAATGIAPWYKYCSPGPLRFSVNYDGNDCTGGNLPDSGSIYPIGETVTVLGNTGGLYRTGYGFTGWNTAASGAGTPYMGDNTFVMGADNVILYAQWLTTFPVRILDTGAGYSDIQESYDHCLNGYTIQAKGGLQGEDLIFNYPISIRLIGGFDSTFTSNPGTTLVSGSIEIIDGSVEVKNIVIR
jgi:uncharacterized repeat protein (TIGR02543 family)